MPRRFDIVLLDADETVYDFKRAEKVALSATLRAVGVETSDAVIAVYSEGNQWCWKALERNDITRDELKPLRFRMLFERIGAAPVDYGAVNALYEQELSYCGYMLPGAAEFLRRLHDDCGVRVYMATNGLTVAQTGRLARSGVEPYIDGIYISEQVGYSKPRREYFDYIFRDLGVSDLSRVIMFGDSLTSDMQGGRNAGIATCHYLRDGKPTGSPLCDWEIADYDDFFPILGV